MVKHAYIHIPFCKSICTYCDFCKIQKNNKWIDKYLDELEKEIDDKYLGDIEATLYIGGGTPSCLDYNQLEKLLTILDKIKRTADCEYTIEGNFESTTEEKLDLYKKHGINRLSFGIETTNKQQLMFLGRKLDKQEVKRIINLAKSKGFNNINVDLIYALPNETISILKKDIDFIKSLDIEHISTYSLIIEDNTILKINNISNIEEELDYEMYKYICKCLGNYYNHYEISNFSKDGFESRHNLGYWNNEEYYGFGLGASSYVNGIRYTNTKSINNYYKGILIENEILDNNSTIEYEIILNLRKTCGIDLKIFKEKYKKDLIELYDYTSLVNKGLLIDRDNHIYIPEEKLYVSNSIISELLEVKNNG